MTKRQSKMADRAYEAGRRARAKGLGHRVSVGGVVVRDYDATNGYGDAVVKRLGAYPDERDDVREAFDNGWNDEDDRRHTQKTDPRTFRHAFAG